MPAPQAAVLKALKRRRPYTSPAMAKGTGSHPTTVPLMEGQVDAAAAVLAASHADYPAFCHVFPDARRRARALAPFFRATVRDAVPFGAVQAAVDGTEVLGVAVWLPPGTFPWSALRKARATPSFMRVLAAYPSAFGTFVRYGSNAERVHPTDRHWYLEVLGIRPGSQRQGLGTRLIQPVLDQADVDGDPCFLETSDRTNTSYYERFGFSVIDDDLHLVPNGPTHVAMRRPGRP